MGRIKEIFTELQNKYGKNLEDMPKGMSLEDILQQKDELFCERFKKAKAEGEGHTKKS